MEIVERYLAVLLVGILSCGLVFANTLPKSNGIEARDVTEVDYLLWTQSNTDSYYLLDFENSDNLDSSPFDGSKRTYFISHGWQGSGEDYWVLNIKSNLLQVEDCNVISVDWRTLADLANYDQAVDNVYLVADRTASYIDWIIGQTSLTTSNIHLMGHSLGAHLSGLAGKSITSGEIDRVSGFDPAGPLFYDKSSDERLDPSDASFVDVIHTNSCPVYTSCAGLAQPTGDVDFYPNGGMHQPGCTLPGDIPGEDWIDFVNGCSHGRSHDYFAESILAGVSGGTDLTFVSWPCDDYDTFDAGGCPDCGDGCLEMGFYVDRNLDGLYYLNTENSEPYAMGDVQS